MRKSPILLAAVLLASAIQAPLAAQSNPVTNSLKTLHETPKGYIMATAELASDDLYAFGPTEEVRTLGQILAHIAGAQFLFCSVASGESSPNSENYEETRTTKASIIEALEAGFAYCDEVYASMTDAKGAASVNLFGTQSAAAGVLAFNTGHNFEHYGNLVTYMRINGIVPPSSR